MVDFTDHPRGAGNLTAICETCSATMNRRIRRNALAEIMPGLDVQIRQALATLNGNPAPSLDCALKEREPT
jgi:hypothetical protein